VNNKELERLKKGDLNKSNLGFGKNNDQLNPNLPGFEIGKSHGGLSQSKPGFGIDKSHKNQPSQSKAD